MPNDVKLQEGHPVDENLRPLKVGGKATAIEVANQGNGARVTGELKVNGDVVTTGGDLAIETGKKIYLNHGKNTYIHDAGADSIDSIGMYANGVEIIRLIEGSVVGDHMNVHGSIYVDAGDKIGFSQSIGDTEIDEESADRLRFTVGGDEMLILDKNTDTIIMAADNWVAGTVSGATITEFSAANSAYAGMILGYTRISNDSTTSGDAHIEPSATMTVLQTAQGTDVSVTFVAPPSGNVEISMLCSLYANSKTLEFALSDNATFNEVAETHTYDSGAQSSDETDINMVYVSFINTGLTAGTSYERWIGAAENTSGSSNIRHGRNRLTGTHYPPIIVKAIALPATITTGE